MTPRTDAPSVLLAEAKPELASLYADWLAEDYAVRTVGRGDAAVDALSPSTDVLVSTLRLPGRTGQSLLDLVDRRADLDPAVVVVTTRPPDFHVVELPFDEYRLKPVDAFELHEAVEEALTSAGAAPPVREYRRLVRTRDLLAAEKPVTDLWDHEGYVAMLDRLHDLADRLEAPDPERSDWQPNGYRD